jgi:hypothetical protein
MAGDEIRVVGDSKGERTGTSQPDQGVDLFVDTPISFLLTRLFYRMKRTGFFDKGEILQRMVRFYSAIYIFYLR